METTVACFSQGTSAENAGKRRHDKQSSEHTWVMRMFEIFSPKFGLERMMVSTTYFTFFVLMKVRRGQHNQVQLAWRLLYSDKVWVHMEQKQRYHHHHHPVPWTTLSSCSDMKVKALVAFKTKISTPCRKLLVLLRLKKPLYTRSRGTPRPSHASEKPQVCALFPKFRSRRKSKEMNRVKELKNISEGGRKKLIPTMPIPPASSLRCVATGMKKTNTVADNVEEEACRSFENYLLEMIVEEGNVKDLMDVEELLYCWKNLKSPVFAELVSRFYGELCKDLFSPEDS